MTFARAQLAVGTPAITVRVATAPPGEAAEIDAGSDFGFTIRPRRVRR